MKRPSILFLLALLALAPMSWAQTIVSTEAQLRNAIAIDGANIQISRTIILAKHLAIEPGYTITIDLNGHSLERHLKEAKRYGDIIDNYGNLTLSNGTLSGGWNNLDNGAFDAGCIYNDGNLTLNNVNITGCKGDDGGGIKSTARATLTINGGSITGCESVNHGGGGIVNYGVLTLRGRVVISGNTAHTTGSGIWNIGTLNIQDSIVIKDNTNDDLYLKEGKKINITGALTGGQNSIGVNMQIPAIFTIGYESHNPGNTLHFFSSGTLCDMGLNENGEGYMETNTSKYIECTWDAENQQVIRNVRTIPSDVEVDNICSSKYASGGDLWGDSYWFIADGVGQTAHGLTCHGSDVHLILLDDALITVKEGFFVHEGTTLHIYCQSYYEHMGQLVSRNTDMQQPGIGPKHGSGNNMGILDIHGGDIKAKGGKYAAAIGGGEDKYSNPITIWGGKIEAVGGDNAAGIGGGEGGSCEGTIKIYGGNVTATGGTCAAGIGGGQFNDGGANCGRIEIYGGEIDATGGGKEWYEIDNPGSGAGIGSGESGTQVGPIIIYGGKVTAHGGSYAAGIGGGSDCTGVTIEIHGGEVWAFGGHAGAGIGGGIHGDGGNILIDQGIVMAYSRNNNDGTYDTPAKGAGIGGGYHGNGGTIVINGGVIMATGEDGSGIGGGWCGDGGSITINGGSVVAIALAEGAGIGGGTSHSGGNININGGEVMAIGGGHKLTFSGGTSLSSHIYRSMTRLRGGRGPLIDGAVNAGIALIEWLKPEPTTYGGAGIGGGLDGNGGQVYIGENAHVTAHSGRSGAQAIGRGYHTLHADDNGTIDFSPELSVSAGSDEAHTTLQLKGNRESSCHNNSFVSIQPCGHKNAANYTDNDDGTYTTSNCAYCELSGDVTLKHIFNHDGDWNDGDNWRSGHVPNPGNDVVVIAHATIPDSYIAVADSVIIPAYDIVTLQDGGQLFHNNSGVMATAEKNITAFSGDGGYSLLTNPVVDGQNPEILGMTKHDYDLYWFDQSQDLEWRNYKQIDFNMENGVGYLYASSNDTLVSFSGELNPANADVSVPVTYDANAYFAGWNLIGNPFVCDAYLADGRDYYVLNPAGDEVVTATTDVIAPLQGIFVQAEANENSISFTTTAPAQGRALNMSVTHGRGAVIDNARIRFGEGHNLEKFQLNLSHSKLYIPQEGKDYAVIHSEAKGELPINFTAKENGTYTLSLSSENMAFSYLHLIDNLTGEDVDLLHSEKLIAGEDPQSLVPTYTFTAKTTDYPSRFKLVFSANDASTGSASDETFAFIDASGNIVMDVETCHGASLQVIDVTGRVVVSSDVARNVSTSGMTPGVYVLRLINGNNVKMQKIIIQ